MERPTALLTAWVADPKDNGTYSLTIGHEDYCRLFEACEQLENKLRSVEAATDLTTARRRAIF